MKRLACSFVLVVMVLVASGCSGRAAAVRSPVPSPSPPPAWLVRQAQAQARHWGVPHPQAAYWGLLHGAQLASAAGGSGRERYVVILVGDYSKAYAMLSFIRSPSTPLPPAKWLRLDFSPATHRAADIGVFPTDFDASRYSGLHPFGW